MRINWFKVLVIGSILFVAAYLYKNDFFYWPTIQHPKSLIYSFALLFFSFLGQAFNWYSIVRPEKKISYTHALASVGLSVFTKYIPGKVLVILGKAEYIRKSHGYPLKVLVSRSFDAQIFVLWSGLILGFVSLVHADKFKEWGVYGIATILLMSLFLFTDYFHRLVERLIKRITNKSFAIPSVNFKTNWKKIPVFFLYWLLLSLAYFFLVQSLVNDSVSLTIAFSFPLAATLGIVLLIAPGGIGIREGILTFLLVAYGVDLALATSIAVFSRLWFLLGEFFLFGIGLIAHNSLR